MISKLTYFRLPKNGLPKTIMLETSVQAQFLIPMVVSLSFGVMFATGVTLVLVPALYLLGDDVGQYLALVTKREIERSDRDVTPPLV